MDRNPQFPLREGGLDDEQEGYLLPPSGWFGAVIVTRSGVNGEYPSGRGYKLYRWLLATAVLSAFQPVLAEQRVALVIGNNAYRHEARLDNPVNDARAMAAALSRLGFEVVQGFDLDREQMKDKLWEFGDRAQQADVAVTFFAGHGIQVEGVNYLLPVDVALDRDRELRNLEPINLEGVLAETARARRLGIVIVDACRNNPFTAKLKRGLGDSRRAATVTRGLSSLEEIPTDTLVAYATKANAVADDGSSQHSPYSEALLEYLGQPGLEVRLMLGKVRDAVIETTKGEQIPGYYSEIGGYEFCFAGCEQPATDQVAALLHSCEQLLDDKQLFSADACFAEVLAKDADNPQALAGRARVSEASFLDALNSQNRQLAGDMLARLRRTQADHPRLAEFEQLYRQATERPAEPAPPPDRVALLLPNCASYFVAKQLLAAEACYKTVLRLADDNPQAIAGLESIRKLYVSQFNDRLLSGDLSRAKELLERLTQLAPQDPEIETLERQIATRPGREFAAELVDGRRGPTMVVIPPGRFLMGSPADEPGRHSDERLHEENIEQRFAVSVYETTVGQFQQFVAATGYRTDAERQEGCLFWQDEQQRWLKNNELNWKNPGFSQSYDRPVTCVSWNDAVTYADWLSEQTEEEYRLPTEAEWEYMARANTATVRYWGNDIDVLGCSFANMADLTKREGEKLEGALAGCRDGYVYTADVGSFEPNGFQLYDMLGNVAEWTCSVYDKDYRGRQKQCTGSRTANEDYVIRGGSWQFTPALVRSAARDTLPSDLAFNFTGFRVVVQF